MAFLFKHKVRSPVEQVKQIGDDLAEVGVPRWNKHADNKAGKRRAGERNRGSRGGTCSGERTRRGREREGFRGLPCVWHGERWLIHGRTLCLAWRQVVNSRVRIEEKG